MRRILLENIASGMKLAKPLYTADGRILLNAGLELRERYISRLRELDVSYIYVEDELTADVEVPDVVSEKTRVEAVAIAKDVMDKIRVGKNVDAAAAKRVTNGLVDELCRSHGTLVNFVDMRSKTDYLFHHSVNVCILSVMTGINLEFDELRLRDLGVGAILHDVGKTQVDDNLLNKTERLTTGELRQVREHARLGFEILRKNPEISLMSAHCAFQHHERHDGSGYPRNLAGGEIHQFAQIVALADVYDALTSDAIYRKAVPVYEAVAIINRAAGSYFSEEIVAKFLANIAPFPIGTVVRLSNNQVGVVVDMTNDVKAKPVVRIVADEHRRRMNSLVEIDLAKNPRLYIADVVER